MTRQVELLIGPPGTGKTTHLVGEVQKAIQEGVNPSKIAYCSFTRKAAEEAVDRTAEQLGLPKNNFPYFRTLHSLAYRELGLQKSQVMRTENFRELGEALGLIFSHSYEGIERVPMGGGLGDKCLRIYSLARAKQTTLRDEWEASEEYDLPYYTVRDFSEALEAYKKLGYLDFTDFLDDCQSELDVDLFILDEAQDLTKQQWNFAKRAARKAKRVLIAGDDDQAIFQWAGADLRTLLSLKGERKVLPKSHRLPRQIYEMAWGISQGITYRYPKQWNPRNEEGELTWITELEQISLAEGTWMLLGRHTSQVSAFEAVCRQQGVVYQKDGVWSNNEPYVRAIVAYERLRAGEEITKREAVLVCGYIVDMYKPEKDQKYKFEDLRFPFEGRPDWMTALSRLSPYDREYVRSLRRNGEDLRKPGRVVISTIHGSKGGEADNVCLLTDMNHRVWKNMNKRPDEEARVWYVGVSRAKKRLFLVASRTCKNFLR